MDAGERAGDAAFNRMKKRIDRIYGNAQREIQRKLADHVAKFRAEDVQKRRELAEGKITMEEYQRWLKLKVWQGQQWQDKLDSVTATLADANESALQIVNGERVGVFAANASYQNFLADQAGIAGAWDVYDQATVSNMLAKNPRLLPPKKLVRGKDKAWNRRQINNCVLQGILQGESIDKIAARMAQTTGSTNRAQMLRTARTSMTSAQNAGRIEAMHHQEEMGIQVQKMWIATLDDRTRDAHAELDGQTVDVDKPFQSALGDIMFPGDPSAAPANVYNCRCTLGYVYPGHPMHNAQRRNGETRDTVEYQTFRQWEQSKEQNGETVWNREHQIEAIENRERYDQGVSRNGVLHTGGHDADGRATRPDPGWQKAHAARYYTEVAARKPFVDARKIAEHVSMTAEEVEDIRQHLFIQEHDFGDGEVHKFFPSYEQAIAWQRLVNGEGTDTDFLMLQHELEELTLVRQLGYNQSEAHDIADERFGWWAKRKKELEGGDDFIAEVPPD